MLGLILIALIGCNEYQLNDLDEGVTAPIEIEEVYTDSVGYSQDWEQLESLKNLDVLVTLDKSGSMSDDWPRVYDGLFALAEVIDKSTAAWNMKFITTDYNPRIGNSISQESWSHTKIKMAVDGMVGGGIEAGLAASYNYLDSHTATPTDDHDLLIIMISDENDQSGWISPETWAAWQLERAEENNYRVGYVPIVKLEDSPCANENDEYHRDIGIRYIEASDSLYEQSEGTVAGEAAELCSDDWVTYLNEYSFLTSLEDTATLDFIPEDPASIQVILNGAVFEDWNYEYPKTINWEILPAPGDLITINYQYSRIENQGY